MFKKCNTCKQDRVFLTPEVQSECNMCEMGLTNSTMEELLKTYEDERKYRWLNDWFKWFGWVKG